MRRALVTGGTKGIGLGIVKMLLSEGFHVTVTYSSDVIAAEQSLEGLKEFEDMLCFVQADQGCYEDMRRVVSHMMSLGHVDCLVCNAGITLRKNLLDITNEDWERVMNVNLNSNIYLVRDLYPIIPPNSRIVFIGSMMGCYPHATSLPYGVSKSALHALAINLVKVFEGSGTTVNVVAPGFVETEWQKDKPMKIRNNIVAKTAAKRFAQVDEIANAVKFCIGNAFVNGSVIEVSGGYCFK